MQAAAFILSGVAAGVFSGSLGVGGALLATPLIRFLGVPPYLAIGTTVPVLLPTTLAGAWTYHRSGMVDPVVVRWTAPGGAIGAVAGALATRSVDGHLLMLFTAALMFALGARTLPGRRTDETGADTPRTLRPPAGLLAVGAAAGFFSGLLGIGGGFLMVPGFIRLFGLPVKTALGTSLAVITITALPNLAAQTFVGNVRWSVAALLALGVVPGALIGARTAIRAPERGLHIAIAVAVMLVAAFYAAVEIAALSSA
ncbi:MAG: sulfite exporter TauE/SafE family protein [Actinomycetota bacterium]